MSKYFARIDQDNTVAEVIVADDLFWPIDNLDGMWVEAHIDQKGKNFPSIGDYYDIEKDNFIHECLNMSWILNPDTCVWEPPVPYPMDGKPYIWSEKVTNWIISPIWQQ
jgi:hypothetical protein